MKPKILKEYYSTGELWREIYTDSNGGYHREDGPAYVWYFENGKDNSNGNESKVKYEAYWVNDIPHREDGPAYVRYFRNGQVEYESYYVNGKELTKEEVEELKRGLAFDEYIKNLLED